MSGGKAMIVRLIAGQIKKITLYKMSYYLEKKKQNQMYIIMQQIFK